ncbi:MAG: GspMb/PilO family protein [Vicinamibacterales bacterium]|nr:GspMb/PilO family protein [Vicinamibacterales bacterium]
MSGGASVAVGRVVGEHRVVIGVLAVVLALNAGAFAAGVVPLSRAVESAERRAAAATIELTAAEADVVAAGAMQSGRDQAVQDLDTFYANVLPENAAEARGMLHTSVALLAAGEGVNYRRLSAFTDRQRDSRLERMYTQMTLDGDYDDIRRFIHRIETGDGFVIIDNLLMGEGSQAGATGLSLTIDLSTYYRIAGGNDR